MKTKRFFPVCALALSLVLLSGCATGRKTPFENYWSESIASDSVNETLVYNVTFEKNDAGYNYELSYAKGSYQTELTSGSNENGQNIYVYKTQLSIEVTFTLEGQSESFTDSVVSEVTFLTAKNELRPLSSKKTVVSHSPVGSNAEKLENCYRIYEYSVDTVYTEANGVSTLVIDNEEGTQKFKIDGNRYSYLDNEQLLLGLRAMPESTSSTRVLSYSPYVDSVQTVAIAFSSKVNAEFSFLKNGSEVTKTISYRPTQMQLDERDPGSIQTAWIACTNDPFSNENRNVMLRLETPLSYNLGTLIYQLASVSYQ